MKIELTDEVIFHPNTHRICISGDTAKLTTPEARLLAHLCKRTNKLSERAETLKSVWGEADYFTGRSMDVYICRLRKLFKSVSDIKIVNIRNQGFILKVKNYGGDK